MGDTIALARGGEAQAAGSGRSDEFRARVFVGLLVLATVSFYVVAPLVAVQWWPFRSLTQTYAVLLYLSIAHVALTAFIYFDRASYRVISTHKLRFLIAGPAFFVSTFWFFYFMPRETVTAFLLFFFVWTYWHYQRQHYGVYSLIKSAARERASSAEKAVILAGAVPGMLAILPQALAERNPDLAVLHAYVGLIMDAAAAALLVCAVAGAVISAAILRAPGEAPLKSRLFHAVLLLFLATNNWPLLFVKPTWLAVAMVAGGHGAQYYVFMAVYGMKREPQGVLDRLTPTLRALPVWPVIRGCFAVAFLFLFAMAMWVTLTTWLPAQPFAKPADSALGAAIGSLWIAITGTHYILDAGLWRLSEPNSRALVRHKYGFLFPR
jgi:hypothetical protein